jgi:hypothetical protein
VVEVVVVGVHDVPVHASQQLASAPTHAPPPVGRRHCAGARLIAHDVLPNLDVRQHVTKPGLPHVDRAAHFLTAGAQPLL